ncbi:pilus assembly protein [Thermocrinis minervae]|uniref:Type IV pilus assembly protein PilY1 n=1 Tax=Thermocrinis minervae TaxID=381751 RepID=A0A1M6Q1I8_9AQUI|nr:PilC/PilY family type IV pilus protein [Thermocrinis minervae]SHK13936.1 type IV pilus assembly protein PilY1 [Thermocrinis minervae]
MKRLLLFALILFLTFLKPGDLKAQNMQDYCYVPPSVGNTAQPNVMLLIDVSGSMSWCAYNPGTYGHPGFYTGCCWDPKGCGNTYTGKEEGYFDPNKVYRWTDFCNTGSYRGGCWVETTGTPSPCPGGLNFTFIGPYYYLYVDKNKIYSGSCLNFLIMTRIDLVRWALTGGTLASCPTGVNVNNPPINRCDPESYGTPGDQTSCDSYGCVLKPYLAVDPYNPYLSYFSSIFGNFTVKVPWSRIYDALLFKLKNLSLKPRMGVMFFSDYGIRSNASVYIGDFVTSINDYDVQHPYKNTITHVNVEDPQGGTPTAPALWDTYNYFAQQKPVYGGLSPQSGQDDVYKNPMYQCFDTNNDGMCQGNEFQLVPCAKNFVILLTDGQWNVGGNPADVTCSIDTGFEQYSADPVVPAYWLHKKGFTNKITGIYSYVEAIYGIGLFLGGTGAQSLKNVAMYGSFDRSKQWPDSLSGYPNGECYVDDCSYYTGDFGKGSGCTSLPPSSPDWDANGDGVPDTFFAASNAAQIKDAIYNAILDILRRASSGSTVATLTGRANTSQLVIQPYFLPRYSQGTQTYSWLGFLRAFWVDVWANLREDTIVNKVLNLLSPLVDKVFQLVFNSNTQQTTAYLVSDVNSCTLDSTKAFKDLVPVMDAGCYLANTDPSSRNIYYNKNGTLTAFTTSEASYLQTVWATDSTTAQNIINYVRGQDISGYRSRTLNVGDFCSYTGITGIKTWKLGDIINSSPAVAGSDALNNYHFKYNDVSYAQYVYSSTYKNRPTIVAVGANDGMLHIFRVGSVVSTGDPNNPVALVNSPTDNNNNLVGQEVFAFIPQNALPYLKWYGDSNYCHIPTVDYRVLIFDAYIGGQWRTLLLGAMGFGGKAITTNTTYSSSIFVLDLTDWLNNNLSGTPKLLWERSLPDRTLTLSFPAVAKVGNNWYVLAGTGPSGLSSNGETYSSNTSIYVFNLADGSLYKQISIKVPGVSGLAVGDIAVVDINNDYSDEYAYFGVYGVKSSGGVYGALYRLDLSSWNLSQAFDFGNSPAPVFAAPTFTKDEYGNLWVFFGTGKYLTSADKVITYNNYLIGFKDPLTSTVRLTDLTDVTSYSSLTVSVISSTQMCVCDTSGCSNRTVVTDAYGTVPPTPSVGWYINLGNSEAIISQSAVFGGTLNSLSLVLPQDVCSFSGSSNLYSVFYKTGTPYPRPTVLSPNAVVNNQVQREISLGTGTPPLGNPFQITSSGGEQFQSYAQISTGVILRLQQQTAEGYGGRFLLWIEK